MHLASQARYSAPRASPRDRPSLTRRKIRQLELATGAPSRKGQVRAHGNRTTAIRDSERALALQAESAYRRTIADWKATRPPATTRRARA